MYQHLQIQISPIPNLLTIAIILATTLIGKGDSGKKEFSNTIAEGQVYGEQHLQVRREMSTSISIRAGVRVSAPPG